MINVWAWGHVGKISNVSKENNLKKQENEKVVMVGGRNDADDDANNFAVFVCFINKLHPAPPLHIEPDYISSSNIVNEFIKISIYYWIFAVIR